MIVEQRTYTLEVGAVAEYLRLYEAEGLPIQEPILGHLVGYFSTEVGPLNRVVHMWAYESFAERSERRARLAADERWRAFVPKLRELVQAQETVILSPAPFSPIR
ncbi:NIPSNAP family protein [Egibacter rhizosphaerae]|uniref:NIPSNAP family protein n=1 Tax=Egibacter rhizosphaerae TaxID=1670831 RepID=A0A411YJR0_9ACTN|nr:NIPSNAP family protein [Egibacter rhizosphaerae]QBI21435.1 NIPSNAP family protein [Egibacter rhizosphaerae]